MAMEVKQGGGASEPDVMVDINTTPLIDVMLVLLVMLIITIPIQLHSVNINMPTGAPPPQAVKPEIVKIDIDPTSVIYWNGEPVEAARCSTSACAGSPPSIPSPNCTSVRTAPRSTRSSPACSPPRNASA